MAGTIAMEQSVSHHCVMAGGWAAPVVASVKIEMALMWCKGPVAPENTQRVGCRKNAIPLVKVLHLSANTGWNHRSMISDGELQPAYTSCGTNRCRVILKPDLSEISWKAIRNCCMALGSIGATV